jgi:hypothetical protein
LAVAEETPLPLAVTVMVRLLVKVARLEAFRLMEPELDVLGWVIVALTPLGRVLVDKVMLPV